MSLRKKHKAVLAAQESTYQRWVQEFLAEATTPIERAVLLEMMEEEGRTWAKVDRECLSKSEASSDTDSSTSDSEEDEDEEYDSEVFFQLKYPAMLCTAGIARGAGAVAAWRSMLQSDCLDTKSHAAASLMGMWCGWADTTILKELFDLGLADWLWTMLDTLELEPKESVLKEFVAAGFAMWLLCDHVDSIGGGGDEVSRAASVVAQVVATATLSIRPLLLKPEQLSSDTPVSEPLRQLVYSHSSILEHPTDDEAQSVLAQLPEAKCILHGTRLLVEICRRHMGAAPQDASRHEAFDEHLRECELLSTAATVLRLPARLLQHLGCYELASFDRSLVALQQAGWGGEYRRPAWFDQRASSWAVGNAVLTREMECDAADAAKDQVPPKAVAVPILASD
jgi:hypothetical protein